MELEEYKRYKYDSLVKDINYLMDYIWINYYRRSKNDNEIREKFNKVLINISNSFTSIVLKCETEREVDILFEMCHLNIQSIIKPLKEYSKAWTEIHKHKDYEIL